MTRRAWCGVLALLAGAAAGPVHAQSGSSIQLQLTGINADTVFGAVSGGTVPVTVQGYDYASRGIKAFVFTLHFDPARVAFVSAAALCPDSATYPLTATPLAAGVRLAADGCASTPTSTRQVARVTLQVLSGATDGSALYLRVDSLLDYDGTNRRLVTLETAAELCHASGVWGDIDGDGVANSRDALIALSSAVGLPTAPYTVERGDVDADGITSSRDALVMLTASIGGYVGFTRLGRPAIDACAPEAALPRRLYFMRGNSTPGTLANGSGFAYRDAGQTTFTLVGDSADANDPYWWRPRVSPDGQSVLFVCYAGSPYAYFNICRSDATGGNVQVLTNDGFYYKSPDWSPDGTQIVAMRSNQIVVMNADGSNMVVIPGSRSTVTSVSWHPVAGSNRILYSTYTDSVAWRSWNDSSATDTLVAYNTAVDFGVVEWSPGGDSLAVDVYYYASPIYIHATWVAPAVPGATLLPRFALSPSSGGSTAPVWSDIGMVFGYYDQPVSRYSLFYHRADGAPFRLMRREARSHYTPGMSRQ
jgi:hypothetical protein